MQRDEIYRPTVADLSVGVAGVFLETAVPAHHAAVFVEHEKCAGQTGDGRVGKFLFFAQLYFGRLTGGDFVFENFFELGEVVRQIRHLLTRRRRHRRRCDGRMRPGWYVALAPLASRLGTRFQTRGHQVGEVDQYLDITRLDFASIDVKHLDHANWQAFARQHQYTGVKIQVGRTDHPTVITRALVRERVVDDAKACLCTRFHANAVGRQRTGGIRQKKRLRTWQRTGRQAD